MSSPDRELLADAIYRALVKYDRELTSMRNLRIALGTRPGKVRGPTIKRGTKRSALALYLSGVVMTELAEQEAAADPPRTDTDLRMMREVRDELYR